MSKIIGMVCWWYDASLFFPFDSIGNIKRTESLTFIVVNVFEIKKLFQMWWLRWSSMTYGQLVSQLRNYWPPRQQRIVDDAGMQPCQSSGSVSDIIVVNIITDFVHCCDGPLAATATEELQLIVGSGFSLTSKGDNIEECDDGFYCLYFFKK